MINMLVVDDERDVEMLFSQRFRKEIRAGEMQIQFAFNAYSALDYLRSLKPGDIMLVLSDINMPGMTGLELLKTIRDEFPYLRVLMVTAYGDDNNYTNAIESGASGFVTKPVDFSILKEKILEVVRN
jgi:two-component system, response regulator, stage 0 sporulation protein F